MWKGHNHIRIAAHDVTGQVQIVCGTTFAGIPLNQDILPLDISQTPEFGEHCANNQGGARLSESGHRVRGMNDGDAVNFSALLRMSGAHRGNGQYTEKKISSPHWITSSATNVQVWLKE